MNNRILSAIARMKTQIESKNLPKEKLDTLHKQLDMDMTEYVRFQELKSVALVSGKLTLDEAQTIYALLGNVPEQFNNQPMEVKCVLTHVFQELLSSFINANQRQTRVNANQRQTRLA